MSLTATDKREPAFDEVIFFTARDFGGQGYLAKIGSRVDVWREHNALSDRLLSVKIGASCTVTAYWAAGFGTPSKQFTADTARAAG
ncbi:beta/gamma crystallin domain-containing protein [Chondromyces apiculatus]|uniref:Calcium-dependent cell adhesion molecule N-terminal domain-containing protein n=1 Tax=Chondromyces apiculatus DSM 436 TaxID=1192034 RepID=A0A017SZM7_9BACT|nr:beta/gamma crystallin domain-containing protein [Chondromyces apiculatus]EYF02217.1 Hypothetical protein CAP_7289 [Chondromyces apiculatus DSM 436]